MRTTMLTTDEQVRATIGRALRAKYKSPRDVFKRLGLEHVLKHPRLSYDAKFAGPNGSFSKATLDRLLADDTVGLTAPNEGLSDEEREGVSIEVEQAEDDAERADRVIDRWRERWGDAVFTDEDVETLRPMIIDEIQRIRRDRSNGKDQDLPANATNRSPNAAGATDPERNGFGGRLSQRSWRDASVDEEVRNANLLSPLQHMTPQERRRAAEISDRAAAKDRKFVADEKRRRAFESRFDLAPRAFECGLESADERAIRAARAEQVRHARRSPDKRIAVDARRGKSARSFAERFPGASRIGVA